MEKTLVTLNPALKQELDEYRDALPYEVSRSAVIGAAIRSFLDDRHAEAKKNPPPFAARKSLRERTLAVGRRQKERA